MVKIATEFIIAQYKSGVENYSQSTKEIGLWESEEYVFKKYLNHSDNILDLGCGTGRTTFPLFKMGYENIMGVDLTPDMIEKALELNDFFQTSIVFKIGDAKKLGFSSAQFDAVIFSFNGLMSIPQESNRTAALVEIKRVLKNNGLFIFTTHDRNNDSKFCNFGKMKKKYGSRALKTRSYSNSAI